MAEITPVEGRQTGIFEPAHTPQAPPVPGPDPDYEKYRKLSLYTGIAETVFRTALYINVIVMINTGKVLWPNDNFFAELAVYVLLPSYILTAALQAFGTTIYMIENVPSWADNFLLNFLFAAILEFVEDLYWLTEPAWNEKAPYISCYGIGEAGKGVGAGFYAFWIIHLLLKIPRTWIVGVFYVKLRNERAANQMRANIPVAVNRDMSVGVFKLRRNLAEGGGDAGAGPSSTDPAPVP